MQELIENWKNRPVNELNELLLDYARDGKLEEVKLLLTSPDLETHADITFNNDILLSCACTSGNLELVRYLLTSPELQYNPDINYKKDFPLSCACESGSVELVKYLIESPELKTHSKIPFVNNSPTNPIIFSAKFERFDVIDYLVSVSENKDDELHKYIFTALSTASLSGELETVKFLLKFPASKSFQDRESNVMYAAINKVINSAFINSKKEIIEFVIGSPEFKQYVDLHNDNDYIFKSLLINANLNKNYEMINYLIYDLNIDQNESIKGFMKRASAPEIEKMFTLRDLNKDLNSELNPNLINIKKVKI